MTEIMIGDRREIMTARAKICFQDALSNAPDCSACLQGWVQRSSNASKHTLFYHIFDPF